jgi:hypothetical protein
MANYGGEHRRERDRWARVVAGGLVRCARCGLPIGKGSLWELDHAEDGSYLGPSHRKCNRQAGMRKAHRAMRQEEQFRPRGSRVW